jgi:hypothetical protein
MGEKSTAVNAWTQREIVRSVKRMAAQCESWMTLAELARKTSYPEASISARLRHLRKPENGGHEVGKRRRMGGDHACGFARKGLGVPDETVIGDS